LGSKILSGDSPVKVKIQNVVASASLGHSLDLKDVLRAFPGVNYRPEVFPGLAFRIRNPRSCTLLFKTGKMVCTRTKSEREAKRAVMNVIEELRRAGIAIRREEPRFEIQNIVASVELGSVLIDLEQIIYEFRGNVMYEPEQFPGLIYRMDDPKVVFLIFASGKLVCVGAKREKDIYKAVEKLLKVLAEKGVVTRG